MKRKINKNRATMGRSLRRLVLGAASLLLLSSTSSFGQVNSDAAFEQYLTDNPNKPIVKMYYQNPNDLNAIHFIRVQILIDNPAYNSTLTPAQLAQMQAENLALLEQIEFFATQSANGVSATEAAHMWERQMLMDQAASNSSTGSATAGSSTPSGSGASSTPVKVVETPVMTTP